MTKKQHMSIGQFWKLCHELYLAKDNDDYLAADRILDKLEEEIQIRKDIKP